MMHDELSLPKHIHHLKKDLYFTMFFKVQEYGEVVQVCLDTI